jgi:hypothetical protein
VLKISVGSDLPSSRFRNGQKKRQGTIKDQILPLDDGANFADRSPVENVSKEQFASFK